MSKITLKPLKLNRFGSRVRGDKLPSQVCEKCGTFGILLHLEPRSSISAGRGVWMREYERSDDLGLWIQ